MANKRTPFELADEWKNGELEFDEAVICHLVDNLGLRPDENLILNISMAISYTNMGQGEEILDLPDCQQITAEEIVAEFGLEPFLESVI